GRARRAAELRRSSAWARSIAIAAITGGGHAAVASALSVRGRGHAIAGLLVEVGRFLVQTSGAIMRACRALEGRTCIRELAIDGVPGLPGRRVALQGQFSCALLGLHGAFPCFPAAHSRLHPALAGQAAAIDRTASGRAHSLACAGWGACAETAPSLPAISRMTP